VRWPSGDQHTRRGNARPIDEYKRIEQFLDDKGIIHQARGEAELTSGEESNGCSSMERRGSSEQHGTRISNHAVSRMIQRGYLVRGMKVSRRTEWNIRNVEKAKNGISLNEKAKVDRRAR
jgi:hypothetical protein